MAYRIRELREKKKLTQEQLSQMSGVSRTTIVQLENNEEHEATRTESHATYRLPRLGA